MKPVYAQWIAVRYDLSWVGFQPVLAFTVFWRVTDFTASRALLLEQEGAGDFRAKLGTAFRVVRLTVFEWQFTLLTKLTEGSSHFC